VHNTVSDSVKTVIGADASPGVFVKLSMD